MKVIGKIHEILRRRIDKENPDSDYYELYPITVADAIYTNEDRNETLAEVLTKLETNYDNFIQSISFPVRSVQIFDGKQFGPIKLGDVKLTAKDFGLDRVDNTPDSEKPISNAQKEYIHDYVDTVQKDIQSTLDSVDDWNSHLTDYNNPHHVTWDQVAPESTVKPEELVDKTILEDTVKKHNESTDLMTLHPPILSKIKEMQAQLTNIENTIQNVDTNIDVSIGEIVDQNLNKHNEDPESHKVILNQLATLSTAITDIIREYSSLNNVELTPNKVEDVSLESLKVANKDDPTLQYRNQYPSVLALRSFLDQLNFTSFGDIQYLPEANQVEVDQIKNTHSSGIIFVDSLDGAKGTHILVYSDKEYLVNYHLPAPSQNFEIYHLEQAPDEQDAITRFGDRHVILLCDRATYTDPSTPTEDADQSIIFMQEKVYDEWALTRPRYVGETNIWEVAVADDNQSFDFDTGFHSGRGVLFVDNLYTRVTVEGSTNFYYTGRPGVVLFKKEDNPDFDPSQPVTKDNMQYIFTYTEVPLGGNTRNVLMKTWPKQPTQKEVLEEIFPPDGTGLVYVDNMYSDTSTVPGFEFWEFGIKRFEQPIRAFGQEIFEQAITGTDAWVSHTFRLTQPFVYESIRVATVVSGFIVNDLSTETLTVDAETVSIVKNDPPEGSKDDPTIDVTVRFMVSTGATGKYIINVMGALEKGESKK